MLVVRPAQPDVHSGSDSLSLQQSISNSGLSRRKSSGDVFRFLGDMTIFAHEQPEYSRQNTHNTLAHGGHDHYPASEMIGSIPGILRQSTLPMSSAPP